MEASSTDPATTDHRLIAPAFDKPEAGDIFMIRPRLDELTLDQIIEIGQARGELHLDVYNPVDPPVCYVAGDHERWLLKAVSIKVTDRGQVIICARWLNQQYEGLTDVILNFHRSSFKTRPGTLEFCC